LNWVQNGAEMSDTARAILSYKGVLYKNHLLNGIKKGALTTEQVEAKFATWLAEKDSKISGKKDSLAKKADQDKADRLKAEAEANAAKAKEVETKNAVVEEVVEEAAEEVAQESTEETTTENSEEVTEVADEAEVTEVENTEESSEETTTTEE